MHHWEVQESHLKSNKSFSSIPIENKHVKQSHLELK